MFLPSLPQKDYFCFEDANKGNCFRKEIARKTTLDPSFGFPPILNLLELKSNPKYIMQCSRVQAVRYLRAALGQVLVTPAPSSAFEQKLLSKRSPNHPAFGTSCRGEVTSRPAPTSHLLRGWKIPDGEEQTWISSPCPGGPVPFSAVTEKEASFFI